jgi:hypothetical protein
MLRGGGACVRGTLRAGLERDTGSTNVLATEFPLETNVLAVDSLRLGGIGVADLGG